MHGPQALVGVGGADEAAIPLALLAIVVVVALSSLWLVYSAPVLFAELTLDALLGAALYRRLRRDDSRHWLETALRKTAWPFAFTLATVVAVGCIAQWYFPEARSIGDVAIALRA